MEQSKRVVCSDESHFLLLPVDGCARVCVCGLPEEEEAALCGKKAKQLSQCDAVGDSCRSMLL